MPKKYKINKTTHVQPLGTITRVGSQGTSNFSMFSNRSKFNGRHDQATARRLKSGRLQRNTQHREALNNNHYNSVFSTFASESERERIIELEFRNFSEKIEEGGRGRGRGRDSGGLICLWDRSKMLKFLKGVVAGSGAGLKDLPYNIGEPYSSAWGSWTHSRGTSKVIFPTSLSLISFHFCWYTMFWWFDLVVLWVGTRNCVILGSIWCRFGRIRQFE